jgi:hypothetical protein
MPSNILTVIKSTVMDRQIDIFFFEFSSYFIISRYSIKLNCQNDKHFPPEKTAYLNLRESMLTDVNAKYFD